MQSIKAFFLLNCIRHLHSWGLATWKSVLKDNKKEKGKRWKKREEGRGRREEKEDEKLKNCKVAQISGLPLHRLSGPMGNVFPLPNGTARNASEVS